MIVTFTNISQEEAVKKIMKDDINNLWFEEFSTEYTHFKPIKNINNSEMTINFIKSCYFYIREAK